jgi:ABC-type transport system involved in multi-copper enzyme maturation permease subunit
MVILPVVERELRAAARGKAAYRVRFYAVLLTLALLFWFVAFTGKDQTSAGYGMELMVLLTIPAFILSLAIGVLATADCVSSEKREGTLGLLFLTDLKGYDVICGKLAANSLNAFYGLVAILPVLSLPVMLGGVTFNQFVRTALTLFCAMILSLSAGIFVSTHSRDERKAMFFTVLLLLAIFFLPILVTACFDNSVQLIPQNDIWRFLMFCPGFGIAESLDPPSPPFPASAFWLSILWQMLLAAAMIARSCGHIPHSWQDRAKQPRRWCRKNAARPRARAVKSRAWLERNPFFWLAMQGEDASPARVWLFVVFVLAVWVVAALKYGMRMMGDEEMVPIVMFVLHTTLLIWIASEASRRFSEDRRNNTFETLLATPLTARQIIHGQWLALCKQFAGPITLVLVWEACMQIHNHHYSNSGWRQGEGMDYWPRTVLLVADAFALAWAGMWLGLRSKGRIRAILAGLALVLFVPWVIKLMIISVASDLFFSTPPIPTYFSSEAHLRTLQTTATLLPALLLDLSIIVCAMKFLPRRFRRLALQRPRETPA